jgi:sigma-54-specific transcriptional regulator
MTGQRGHQLGAPVLVIGESGTGKELTARAIHAMSGRAGPFLAVNCGAFSEQLIDAELFGHEAGAFTGADRARAGWFEAAHGGTLFLDEIGEMPLALQVKLLRVLQEGQVVRLGSRRTLAVNARLIAATHVDLGEAVAEGRFRADLYYRLNVAPIQLAPLRERRAEILPLARQFIERYAAEPVRIGAEAAALLEAHAWPGNIRELENVIQFALIICRGGEIRPSDLRLIHLDAEPALDDEVDPALEEADLALAVPPGLAEAIGTLLDARAPNAFHQIEALVVKIAFEKCRGNQVQAAQLLGITRNTMRTLLRRFGLGAASPSKS